MMYEIVLLFFSFSVLAQENISAPVHIKESGVAVYPFENEPKTKDNHLKSIPRLQITPEDSTAAQVPDAAKFTIPEVKHHHVVPLETPSSSTTAMGPSIVPAPPLIIPKSIYDKDGFGIVTLQKVYGVTAKTENDPPVTKQITKPLADEELKYLGARLLYERQDKCNVALGLFYELTIKITPESILSKFYLGTCLAKLKLYTPALEYLFEVLKSDHRDLYSASTDLLLHFPQEFDVVIGQNFLEVINRLTFSEDAVDRVNFLIAKSAVKRGDHQAALRFSELIRLKSEYYYRGRFISAVAQYATGHQAEALTLFKRLGPAMPDDTPHKPLRAFISLYLERTELQNKNYSQASIYFSDLQKDDPLWIAGFSDYGWAQIATGNFKGVLESTSAFQKRFRDTYKPESHALRTMTYMQLCQFSAAERELAQMETEYRPIHEKIKEFKKRNSSPEKIFGAADELPRSVLNEIKHQMDFLNMQNEINIRTQEISRYNDILKPNRNTASVSKSDDIENFQLSIYHESEAAFRAFKDTTMPRLDQLRQELISQAGRVLKAHLDSLDQDLEQMLDNLDFMKFEVYEKGARKMRAGIGDPRHPNETDNICFQEQKAGQL